MLSDDGFLSALSFRDAAPRRPSRSPSAGRSGGSPSPIRGNPASLFAFTPTTGTARSLYTAVSTPGAYPSDYPYAPYNATSNGATTAGTDSRAAGSHPCTYAWWGGALTEGVSTACPAEVRAAEEHGQTVASEAERQRRILEMERVLAEEQRERLAERLSQRPVASSSSAAASAPAPAAATVAVHASPSRSPSRRAPSPQEASPAVSESARRPSPSLSPHASEDGAEGRFRAFSMEALPPPSSPSPPSAHVHRRHGGPVIDVVCDDAQREGRYSREDRLASTAVVYAMPDDDVVDRPSPSPSPPSASREPIAKAQASEPPPRLSKPPRASPSASPPRSAPRARTPPLTTPDLYSVHAPIEQDIDMPIPRMTRPPSMGTDRSEAESTPTQPPRSASRAIVSCGATAADEGGEDEEERLYDAYRRKLARIQDALRPQYTAPPPLLPEPASTAAYRAYEQRRRLTTPALDPRASLSRHAPQSPSCTHEPRGVDVSAAVRQRSLPCPPPLSLRLRGGGGVGRPLTLRAPSSEVDEGITADMAVTSPLPQRPRRRLRWDLARSGNITLSADGAVCRADATDALGLIEREYDGRLDEVLRRLVIPFYAAGSLGLTHGSLTFALRWTSPSASAGSAPALAFGVATRDFAGYGAAAPAFLYLSSGVIAQGVPTRGGGGGNAARGRGVERPYGAPYTPGLELAARLDLCRGELEFFVEGVSMGVAFRFQPAQHPAPLFPVVVFAAELDAAELLYAAFE